MKRTTRKARPIKKVLPTVPQIRLSTDKLPRHAPGDGNPAYGHAYVTRSAFINWTDDVLERDADIEKAARKEGPFTLSAGPRVGMYAHHGWPEIRLDIKRRDLGDPMNRVTVTLGECAGGPGVGQDLELGVEFPCPMMGTQVAHGPITIEQALSFEEAVRAVFEAARQVGLLPIASKYRRRK